MTQAMLTVCSQRRLSEAKATLSPLPGQGLWGGRLRTGHPRPACAPASGHPELPPGDADLPDKQEAEKSASPPSLRSATSPGTLTPCAGGFSQRRGGRCL